MRISIRVKPNAKKNAVEQLEPGHFRVSVTAPPVDNKANEKVIELLAFFFRKPKRAFTMLRGASGKEKVVEIAEES
jgi:uncharacterized protein (TIGR00251 family)